LLQELKTRDVDAGHGDRLSGPVAAKAAGIPTVGAFGLAIPFKPG